MKLVPTGQPQQPLLPAVQPLQLVNNVAILPNQKHDRILEQLNFVVDATRPILEKFLNVDTFQDDGMKCQTLLLDVCENILSSANDSIEDCKQTEGENVIGDDKEKIRHCAENFMPRLNLRIDRLGSTFAKCMRDVNMACSTEGNTAIMTTIKENIFNIINK